MEKTGKGRISSTNSFFGKTFFLSSQISRNALSASRPAAGRITGQGNSEYSSGGKQKLLGISKRGNCYIRKLLIQGARVICTWWNRNPAKEGQWRRLWLQQLTARRGKFVASVARTNKTARIIWNVLAHRVEYSESLNI